MLSENFETLRRRRIGRSLFIIFAHNKSCNRKDILLCDGFKSDLIIHYGYGEWACDEVFSLTEIQKNAVKSFIVNYCI